MKYRSDEDSKVQKFGKSSIEIVLLIINQQILF